MNLFDLRLQSIRAVDVKGEAYNTDEEHPGYAGRFQADILGDISSLAVGDTFEAKLSFSTRDKEDDDPFFSLSISGLFYVVGESAISAIKGEFGSYQIAIFLFPYLRNLAKPILEHLGATDVEFPFHLPPPPKAEPKKLGRRKSK